MQLQIPGRERKGSSGKTGHDRARMTVQVSESLVEAIEARSGLEAMPNAGFIRRAVTQYVENPPKEPVDVSKYTQPERAGERGPLRQWPKRLSYVVDADVAERLSRMASIRSETVEEEISPTDLVREAIVRNLDGPSFPSRALARDEAGFTTSGAEERDRAAQKVMDDAWRSTNEE